jgi:hypothetical protein
VILMRRLIPCVVPEGCRRRSKERLADHSAGWIAAGGIIAIWILLSILVGRVIWRRCLQPTFRK